MLSLDVLKAEFVELKNIGVAVAETLSHHMQVHVVIDGGKWRVFVPRDQHGKAVSVMCCSVQELP